MDRGCSPSKPFWNLGVSCFLHMWKWIFCHCLRFLIAWNYFFFRARSSDLDLLTVKWFPFSLFSLLCVPPLYCSLNSRVWVPLFFPQNKLCWTFNFLVVASWLASNVCQCLIFCSLVITVRIREVGQKITVFSNSS